MLRMTLRQVLAECSGAAVPARLSDLGWAEVVADDAPAAVGALFEEQGRALCPSPALDGVVLHALRPWFGDEMADAAVLYPAPETAAEPSSIAKPGAPLRIEVRGIALAGLDRASRIMVPMSLDGEIALGALDREGPLRAEPAGGFDPEAGWLRVEGTVTVPDGRVVGGSDAAAAWSTAVRAAHRAQGHELVGMTERILEIAVEHVTNRHQFGRAIGSYQAVKHRLAEVLVTLEAARSALRDAWGDDRLPLATVARILSGRAQDEAARHGLQVCGAMGFTWEFPLHRYVRRGVMADALLGSWSRLREALGADLIATGRIPRLPAL
jgi:hypothetical protein